MNVFHQLGKAAIGSKLRQVSAKVTDEAAKIYKMYGVDLQPKWFPVFYSLSGGGEKAITEIAAEVGHSQPSVSKIVREMSKKGLVEEKKTDADGRRNMVRLSAAGIELTEKIKDQYTDVQLAIEGVLAETTHDLWKALEEWEYSLAQQPLSQRVREQRKIREAGHIRIVDYEDAYQATFRALNVEWISAYFKMEEADYKALDNPQGYILKPGGQIVVALYRGKPVGVCALIKMQHPKFDFELAKMAVSPSAQGLNIGRLLGQAVIEKARSLGAKSLYLESNTVLKPAIGLYQKLGFRKITGEASPYERCNIQMELSL
jgi:DNA-binding MarR family transcriptional regulator/predicted GNAT family N-acyltransferase